MRGWGEGGEGDRGKGGGRRALPRGYARMPCVVVVVVVVVVLVLVMVVIIIIVVVVVVVLVVVIKTYGSHQKPMGISKNLWESTKTYGSQKKPMGI